MYKKTQEVDKPLDLIITPLEGVTSEELLTQANIVESIRTFTISAIRRAIKENKDVATVLEINNSGYLVEIEQKDWASAIKQCFNVFLEKEDYDSCKELQKLEEIVSTYTPKKKSKSKE